MKVTYTLENGLTVEIEGKTHTDIWEQLAQFQETFGDTTAVGKINGQIVTSNKVRFVKRTVDDNDYYELVCVDPNSPLRGYKKHFGLHKKGGTMFPKYEVPEGNIPGLNGWHKYVKNQSSSGNQGVDTNQSTPPNKSKAQDSDVPF